MTRRAWAIGLLLAAAVWVGLCVLAVLALAPDVALRLLRTP